MNAEAPGPNEPSGSPPPGWYPDPTASGTRQLRWWDGHQWAQHTQDPAPQPRGWSQPGEIAWSTNQRPEQVTESGLRPLGDFFADVGRILRRGWKQLLGISALVWFVAAVMIGAMALLLFDVGAVDETLQVLLDDLQQSPDGLSAAAQARIEQLWDTAIPYGPAIYIGAGLLLLAILITASALQVAGVNRAAVDAASDLPVTWTKSWFGAARGAPRLILFWALVVLGVIVVISAVVALSILLGQVAVALGVLTAIVLTLVALMAGIWLTGRLILVTAEAPMGRRPVRWAWQASRGRVLGILGRSLVWAIVAGIVASIVTSALFWPLGAAFEAALTGQGTQALPTFGIIATLVGIPIYQAIAGFTYLGAVPIWRDVTEREQYRALPQDVGAPKRQVD